MRSLAFIVSLGLWSLVTAGACQVPVFRYALERWPADRYELVIFARGPVHAEVPDTANIDLVTVDVTKLDPGEQAIYGIVELPDGQPLMRLYYPREVGIEGAIWEAPFSAENLARVVDSPARRDIRRRILAGASAVWVIVDGDPALEAKLAGQLRGIGASMEIPEGVIGPGNLDRVATGEVAMEDVLRSSIPLAIGFEVLRIRRDDPAEGVLLAMLFGVSQGALEAYPDAPLLFPVFGRGRSIDGVPAPLAGADLLRHACEYLCGACSCEVKKDNPGIDLIMDADWDALIAGSEVVYEKALPPLSGAGDLTEAAAESLGGTGEGTRVRSGDLAKNAVLAAGAFVVLVIGATLVLKGKGGAG